MSLGAWVPPPLKLVRAGRPRQGVQIPLPSAPRVSGACTRRRPAELYPSSDLFQTFRLILYTPHLFLEVVS